MDTLLVIKWQWPNGASFWSTHADIGVDGRIRDWPGLNLTPTWARRLELGAGDANLLATIRKAGGDLLSGASDDGEFSLRETEAWVVEAREDDVDLTQGGSLAGLSHDALSEFLLAENGSIEKLADWANRHGQSVFARIAALEATLAEARKVAGACRKAALWLDDVPSDSDWYAFDDRVRTALNGAAS